MRNHSKYNRTHKAKYAALGMRYITVMLPNKDIPKVRKLCKNKCLKHLRELEE